MGIEQWWPKVRASTQRWLTENNGDTIPDELAAEITVAGGVLDEDSLLTDHDSDWIEAVANGETPDPAPDPVS
jgi:hypothetical protein